MIAGQKGQTNRTVEKLFLLKIAKFKIKILSALCNNISKQINQGEKK